MMTLFSNSPPMHHPSAILESIVVHAINKACTWCCWPRTRVVILLTLVFVHKKYPRSFVKLWFNRWCHMDYFNDVLGTFLDLKNVVVALLSMDGHRALGFNKKNLNFCSEDERMSYRFGTSWGRVIKDRIFFFWWTISLIHPRWIKQN